MLDKFYCARVESQTPHAVAPVTLIEKVLPVDLKKDFVFFKESRPHMRSSFGLALYFLVQAESLTANFMKICAT